MSRKMKITIMVLEFAIALMFLCGSAALIALKETGNIHVWEDGSWAIGQYPYPITGCPAGQLCSTNPGPAICATWADSHGLNTEYLTEHNVPVADCNGIVEFGE